MEKNHYRHNARTDAQLPLAYHQVARTQQRSTPFEKRDYCQKIWSRMAKYFKHNCIAAVLMPDHIHLLTWSKGQTAESLRDLLFRVLHEQQSHFDIVPAQPLPDMKHVKRTLRYIHLNPCRSALTADPLNWEWSTHLDYMGAIAFPWPRVKENLLALGFNGGARELHAFVSGDPTVHPLGSPPPTVLQAIQILDTKHAQRAATIALRAPDRALMRKGRLRARYMALMTRMFGISATRVARELGVHRSSACRPSVNPKLHPHWHRATSLILADHRLLTCYGRATSQERNKVSSSALT